MNWLLIIIAVSINNPADVPATLVIEQVSKQHCEQALASMKYKIKFDSYKVVGKCERVKND